MVCTLMTSLCIDLTFIAHMLDLHDVAYTYILDLSDVIVHILDPYDVTAHIMDFNVVIAHI